MEVPGASVDVDTIEGGIALTFTTIDAGSIAEMRASVHHLATAFQHGEEDHEHARFAGQPHGHYRYEGFPSAHVNVVDLDTGARIELTAAADTRVPDLRAEARAEADLMRRGACPLLPMELAGQPSNNL